MSRDMLDSIEVHSVVLFPQTKEVVDICSSIIFILDARAAQTGHSIPHKLHTNQRDFLHGCAYWGLVKINLIIMLDAKRAIPSTSLYLKMSIRLVMIKSSRRVHDSAPNALCSNNFTKITLGVKLPETPQSANSSLKTCWSGRQDKLLRGEMSLKQEGHKTYVETNETLPFQFDFARPFKFSKKVFRQCVKPEVT
jgi:hypothetical protein